MYRFLDVGDEGQLKSLLETIALSFRNREPNEHHAQIVRTSITANSPGDFRTLNISVLEFHGVEAD